MQFTFSDMLSITSLAVGIVSIVLALYAMKSSKTAEKESRENFQHTQKMMNDIYSQTKDLLHEIDKKSAVIEEVTQKHQMQLTQLFSNVLDRVIQNPVNEKIEEVLSSGQNPSDKKIDNNVLGQQLAMQLLPELIKNPESLSKLVEVSEKLKKQNGSTN